MSLLASLAHTRAGITDAMLTVGLLYELIDRLYSENEQVDKTVNKGDNYLWLGWV